ncbi:hypothetical protein ACJRO7_007209 [Eucalyptus globulus]|uniref:Histone H4 n=1 Tax=Eucalyptus globulus TaxID=34317 RepID=A0ABD3IKG9_EUCGL
MCMSGLICEETHGVLEIFLENAIRDAMTYTELARRKTVTAMGVVCALKRQGWTSHGPPIEVRQGPQHPRQATVKRRKKENEINNHKKNYKNYSPKCLSCHLE